MTSKSLFHCATALGRAASTLLLASVAVAGLPASAAVLPNRLHRDAQGAERAELPQGVSARVTHAEARGHLSAGTQLSTMSLVLAPSAAQSAALDQLILDQQNPASASYHRWLTPEQFGARFGVSDDDLLVLENWLTSQGLQVVSVAPSRNAIQFSGSATTVESAFRTSLGRFHRPDQDFFENSTAPTIPADFQGVVTAVNGLSSYRLRGESARRQMRPTAYEGLGPNVTGTDSAGNVTHALSPYDVRQIYGASPLFTTSGFTGAGLKIGVIGQSAVNTTQLGYFQTLTGQTVKAPTLTLVPNSGTSTIVTGDEGESEADLEYAGGVAPGATLLFLYTGNSATASVITALEYAITTNAAPVLTLSYGGCEPASLSGVAGVEPYLRQANAQGQTILVSSGDSGAAGCDDAGVTAAQDGLQVSYPASSPYVTAIGGTTFNEGTGTGYWATTNNSQLGSALGYIPEVAWNDSTQAKGALATGGGASVLFSKPNWQVGTGVPADGARDVPDISFSASNYHDAYILCTADTGYTGTNSKGVTVTGACTSTALGAFQVGGTSLSAPSFAGLLTLVLQANGSASLGNINPSLYSLRSSQPAIFHDITGGTNIVPCVTSTQNCTSGSMGYSTTAGYDLVTGLGSLDVGRFSTAIKAAVAANLKVPTVNLEETAITATTMTFRVTVASTGSSTVPTGTVSVTVDGGTATVLTLSSGMVNYVLTTSSLAAGKHTLVATYSGDSNYSSASSTQIVSTTQAGGTLAATATSVSVASGGTGTITLVVTAGGGYSGLVVFDKITAASGSSLPAVGCFLGRNDLAVTSGAPAITTITFHTLAADCTTTSNNLIQTGPLATLRGSGTPGRQPERSHLPLAALLIGGGLLGGLATRRRNWAGGLIAVAFTASLLSLNGCGSGSAPLSSSTTTGTGTSTTAATATAKGTYTVLLKFYTYPSLAVSTTAQTTITVQ